MGITLETLVGAKNRIEYYPSNKFNFIFAHVSYLMCLQKKNKLEVYIQLDGFVEILYDSNV